MERGLVFFGIIAVAVGLGCGYMIYSYPQGLNPSWPIWMAMLAPAVFILGGIHMIAAGLDRPGVAHATVRAIVVCLLAIVNWAAFFTTHVQCRETVSFLEVPVLTRYPGEAECRSGLRIIVGCIDVLILLLFLGFAWSRRQKRNAARTE
jgi:hypothetical protein